MKLSETIAAALLVNALMITLPACDQQAPLDEAGEEIDDTAEDTDDAIEDAADDAG
jgi:hypothetical protein